MQSIQNLINKILFIKKRLVLAIVVDVQGSAYRKEGAWMVFIEGEEPIGLISGGCLEEDLHKRAQNLYGTERQEIISYDMSDEEDTGWGRGAGCNGIVNVLLRDIDLHFLNTLQQLEYALQQNEAVLFIQSMSNFNAYTISSRSNDRYGFWEQDSNSEWLNLKSFQKVAGQRKYGNDSYFIQVIWPNLKLYIIGAAMDARPLCKYAVDLGYDVYIIDWRKYFCQKEFFPGAKQLICGSLQSMLQSITWTPLHAVIVMTHDFQKDLLLVEKLKNKKLFYFGILGSKKRTERLLNNESVSSIHSPVGLSIGADGPYEIAISIIAELIAKKNGRPI